MVIYGSQSSALVDFTSYNDKGVYMTTGDFNSNYEPIGIIEVECSGGYILKGPVTPKLSSRNAKTSDDLYGASPKSDNPKDYVYKECYLNDLLDNLFSYAKENNANGIINIEIIPTQSGIRIIGMAINY